MAPRVTIMSTSIDTMLNRAPATATGRGAWAVVLLAGLGAVAPAGEARAATFGPTPYVQRSDSPFAGHTFSWFHLEDFEGGALGTPGVSASAGFVLGPGALTDSVDEDDGVVDGFGNGGRSSYSADQRSITFTFDAVALGGLPTHAGLVWTDVGFSDFAFSVGHVRLEAFDAMGVSVGVIGPVQVGDGAAGGGTAEDRFLGVEHLAGIKTLVIGMPDSSDWELDHLQYGRSATPIPAPAAAGLAALAGVAASRRRR